MMELDGETIIPKQEALAHRIRESSNQKIDKEFQIVCLVSFRITAEQCAI